MQRGDTSTEHIQPSLADEFRQVASTAMTSATTSIASYGVIDSQPKERYGAGETLFRIGNGGAGATGLLEALANDYLSKTQAEGSIDWICNHSRNTQLALLNGYIDIALTYERDQEALAASEGWSVTVGCAFHDHFVLAGPPSDPAGISSSASLLDAFSCIAQSRPKFFSRADASATMSKERSVWILLGLKPWSDQASLDQWYHTSQLSPAEALLAADAAGAYLLTDRSTLLRQTALGTIHNTTVFFEPTQPDDVLMNSCYASTSSRPSTRHAVMAERFLEYILSDQGQQLIASFGKDELGGFPLFASMEEGFARTFLRGGVPRGGRWML